MPNPTSTPIAWRQILAAWSPHITLATPVGAEQIAAVGQALGCGLPGDLASLLAETDGVTAAYATPLVWPADRIRADNLSFRANAAFRDLYMPIDHLLFFGDAGNGDQFALAVINGRVLTSNVFAWNHETDSRDWVGANVHRYLEGCLSGRIAP